MANRRTGKPTQAPLTRSTFQIGIVWLQDRENIRFYSNEAFLPFAKIEFKARSLKIKILQLDKFQRLFFEASRIREIYFKLEGITFFVKAVTTDRPTLRVIERAEQAILCSITIPTYGTTIGGDSLREPALKIIRKGSKIRDIDITDFQFPFKEDFSSSVLDFSSSGRVAYFFPLCVELFNFKLLIIIYRPKL